MKPMLSKAVDTDALVRLANDPAYYFQQKLDGQRILILVDRNEFTALNRDGNPITRTLTDSISEELARLPAGSWVLDCELVANVLWVFDLPQSPGESTSPYAVRSHKLSHLFQTWQPAACIQRLPDAVGLDKLKLATAVLRSQGEGIIAKDFRGLYMPGVRSNTTLKVKFCKDIDCVVTDLGRDGKQNVGLGVYDNNGNLVDVGEVTALAGDGPDIKVGDVVCVKYLYAVDPQRPRLYQPTLPRLRDDKSAEQCTVDQLDHAYRNLTVLTSWD